MAFLRSSFAVLIVLAAGAGCSLLAPSRDELSGGKVAARDGATVDDSGAGGGSGAGAGLGGAGVTTGTEGGGEGGNGGAIVEAESDVVDSGQDAPLTILGCDSLRAVGQWEQITPPEVSLACPDSGYCGNFGTEAFVLDPQNAGTIYLGTSAQGIWKSSNCGSTWSQLNTGSNSTTVSAGTQRIFEIDPVDPKVMYTKGNNNAAFKSTNGGVDWATLWPPADAVLSKIVDFNVVGYLSLYPNEHQHFLLSFGANCTGSFPKVCFAETKDAGATWNMIAGRAEWLGGDARVWFLDASTWLYGSGSDGLWRSPDKGVTWQQLADKSLGAPIGRLFRAADGTFYLGAVTGILRSKDGAVWTLISGTQFVSGGIVSDGASLFASSFGLCGEHGTNQQFYSSSMETDGKTWSALAAPGMTQGAWSVGYDLPHHVYYSSNCRQGFWRVVTR